MKINDKFYELAGGTSAAPAAAVPARAAATIESVTAESIRVGGEAALWEIRGVGFSCCRLTGPLVDATTFSFGSSVSITTHSGLCITDLHVNE